MKKYKIGYVSGFFDIIHEGHIRLLKAAKEQCEMLIVAIGTDEFMKIRKKRNSVLNYAQRVEIVKAIKYVDLVVPETDLDKVHEWKKYKFDVMFAGDDHVNEKTYIEAQKILNARYGVDVIYVKRNATSSSSIRKRVKDIGE